MSVRWISFLSAIAAPLYAQDIWTPLTLSTGAALFGISCPSRDVCVAVGPSGLYHRTTNGGSTWPSDFAGGEALNAVHCMSADLCIAVNAGGRIFRTANGGGSWSNLASGFTTALNAVDCRGAVCVAAGAQGALARSTDSGKSWASIPSGTAATFNAVRFAGGDTVYGLGDTLLVRSTSGGAAPWSGNLMTGVPHFGLGGMHFTDGRTGWAVGGANGVFRTTDAGSSWQDLSPTVGGSIRTYAGIHRVNASTGYIFAREGYVYKFENGAVNLTPVVGNGAKQFYAMAFPDSLTGYVVSSGLIYRLDRSGPVRLNPPVFATAARAQGLRLDRNVIRLHAVGRLYDLRGTALHRVSGPR